MSQRFPVFLSFLLICSMVLVPGLAGAGTGPVPLQQERAVHLQQVPAEIAGLFPMTLDEYVARTGHVPQAVGQLVGAKGTFVVELEQPPLAVLYAGNGLTSAAAQRAYLEELRSVQAGLVPQLNALGATVLSRYTKAYNGFLLRAPFSSLAGIRALPGVRAIHRAPVHRPNLSVSVPLIGAPEVWDLGYEGAGISIGIIDTGIDYYHAAFGGSGDPADYADDDHSIIEPGTFPTAKVVGGYDFAGPDYNPCGGVITPTADLDPIDGDDHGTHVASIAAGLAVTGTVSRGVAPTAELYALKVFGEPAGCTNLTMDAIEWAMDPNGDDNTSDHLDVINMSLGSDFGPGDTADPSVVASNNAAAIGVIVVASAGNAGDSSYIVGSPSTADRAISVAASTTGYATGPTLDISGTAFPTQTGIIYQPPAFDNNTGHFTAAVTAWLGYAGNITGTDTLCDITGIPTDTLAGQVALIQRGACAFTLKVNNAAALGAVGAIIFNNAVGGNARMTMIGGPVAIPAGFIAHDDGMNLVPADGETVLVSAEDDVSTVPDPYTPADSIAGFSSRGPRGTDSMLKPDITAPGVGIFAANMGTGTGGTSKGGTSMAAPHVAGVAALLRQAHPAWTVEQVKAAMMNSALDLADGSPVPRQGAGRVQAYEAVTLTTMAIGDAWLVSLNWGVLPIGSNTYSDTKGVTLYNLDTVTKTYETDWSFYTGSFTAGVDLDLPFTATVPAAGLFTVPVTLNIDATQMAFNDFYLLEEYHGYVGFVNVADPEDQVRVPFYLVPRPYTTLAELGSSTTFTPTGYAWLDLEHSGPISSSLWVYPVYAVDPAEAGQGDEGDIRLVGMDYGWADSTYGDVFVPAIDTHGQWHVPQPYFAEFDLWLDTDRDGNWDLVDWNSNSGWFSGQDDTNDWMVVQYDFSTGFVYLASPWRIWTDYNAGFQEWYLPATWNGLEDIAPGANTDFDFQFLGYDANGNEDQSQPGRFNIAMPPFSWGPMAGYPDNPGPGDPQTVYSVSLDNWAGYNFSLPYGVMIVDCNGMPGTGQAYYWALTVEWQQIFLPLVFKGYGAP